jgi:hypothetical protein
MNRTSLLVVAVAGIVLIGSWFVRPALTAVEAQPKAQPATQWEYAELSSVGKSKAWSTSGKSLTAPTWPELMKKLGVKGDRPFVALLDRIGSDGWELATHTTASVSSGGVISTSEYWTFKRPVK